MSEENREDHAFLAGIRSALESDAGVGAEQLAAIRLAAAREQRARRPARRWMPASLKAAAALVVAAGLGLYCARSVARRAEMPVAIQAIALVGELDRGESISLDGEMPVNGADRLLALQDAPYYEAVANIGDFGDNIATEF